MKVEDLNVNHNIVTIIANNVSYTTQRVKHGEQYLAKTIELPLAELHKDPDCPGPKYPDTLEWSPSLIGASIGDFEWYLLGTVLLHALRVDSIIQIKETPVRTLYYKEADNLFVFIDKEGR